MEAKIVVEMDALSFVTLVGLHALFLLVPILYLRNKKKHIVKETGLEKKKLKLSAKPTILIFAAILLTALVLGAVFFAIGISDSEKVGEKLKEQNRLLMLYAVLVGVPLEEFFFRGFLVKRIGKEFSSILFGVLHSGYGSVAEVVGATVLGYVLAIFFKKYENLYANTFAHILYNLVVFAAIFYV